MALNLSTLTSPATSGDVLAEALTTADFLEPCPVLRNLSRGSNKGGDAKQDVALNQPKALPLDANGNGYLYLSGVTGNYASVPDPLGSLGDFTMQVDGLNAGAVRPAGLHTLMSQYEGSQLSFILRVSAAGEIYLDIVGSAGSEGHGSTAVPENTVGIRITRVGTLITYWVDTGSGYVSHATDTGLINPLNNTYNALEIGSFATGTSQPLKGKISRALIWDNGTQAGDPVLDIDFTATNVRHGDTKFKCATGQVVTINQSGNDPATIIKKPVLRFANKSDNSTNISLSGLLNQVITDGYMFAAFSVLGDGGESFGRIFGLNATGGIDSGAGGVAFRRNGTTTGLMIRYNEANTTTHSNFFDDERGDYLLDVKVQSGSQQSKANNADLVTGSVAGQLNAEEFSVASFTNGIANNPAIDLEYLALFPATITDAQADSVRNYINNRNNVFSLVDGFGYYFYDAQKAPVGNISSGSASWNGRIVGSDFGDTDKYATQSTSNDSPVGDGFKVTFADNTDHLDIPSISQSGYQIVGTSLGTFLYKVRNEVQSEFSLLGYIGNASYRQAGHLYGVMLLPESATTADLNSARKLLTDRGASDGATSRSYYAAWFQRDDIVEFGDVNLSAATNLDSSWGGATALVKFSPTDISNCTVFSSSWSTCTSLNDFAPIQAPLGNNFSSAWKSTSALTSFPAGAKLGTAATNVNFTSAWQSSGLTSFPALDLSTGTNFASAWTSTPLSSFGAIEASSATSFYFAWNSTSSLTSFPSGAKLGTAAANVDFTSAWQQGGLTSFSTPLPTARSFQATWFLNSSLVDFSADVLTNWNPSSITSGVFNLTWNNCPLTADSVENILTSIDASGKYATTNGASGGTALGDAGIDIDYNVATGSLSAATNTAVTSLKAKGWSIIVNNVTL